MSENVLHGVDDKERNCEARIGHLLLREVVFEAHAKEPPVELLEQFGSLLLDVGLALLDEFVDFLHDRPEQLRRTVHNIFVRYAW